MYKRFFERLQTIDYLIRIKGTGNPTQLAKRLRISERTLFEFLKIMKELGAPIAYDRYKQTYYYREKGGFNIKFRKALATAEYETADVIAGRTKRTGDDIVAELEATYETSILKKPKFGSAKGKIRLSPDFDDPLEDFNDYI